jgi:hypothetical protein
MTRYLLPMLACFCFTTRIFARTDPNLDCFPTKAQLYIILSHTLEYMREEVGRRIDQLVEKVG